jgi:hypothetical protein
MSDVIIFLIVGITLVYLFTKKPKPKTFDGKISSFNFDANGRPKIGDYESHLEFMEMHGFGDTETIEEKLAREQDIKDNPQNYCRLGIEMTDKEKFEAHIANHTPNYVSRVIDMNNKFDIDVSSRMVYKHGALSTWPMIEKLVDALDNMILEQADYERLNNLGEMHSKKQAMIARKQFREGLEK